MLQVEDLVAKHARYVLTPWSAQGTLRAPVIASAHGVYLEDVNGKRYLDLSSGLVAANLGHAHPRLIAAITEQASRVCFAPPGWFSDVRAELAEALVRLAPWTEGGRVFFTAGGAEANEDAVKIARVVSGRSKVLAAYRSFHGSTFGSGTLTGENRRWPVEPGIGNVVHFFAPFPYRSPFNTSDPGEECTRALSHLKNVIGYEDPERIAAIVLEPVVGSNGVVVYPKGYLAGVRALCDKYGILFIADEVMTGFGRTGAAFGSERFGIIPDLMTFAKGVTGAYVPCGGVIVRETLAQHFDENVLNVGHTYSGHPLAMATGIAALEAYRDENLYARAAGLEPYLRERLETLRAKHPSVGDIRGVGAFFAIEFTRDRANHVPLVPWQGKGPALMAPLFASLRERGVYAMGRYNILHVAPPLVISNEEVDEAVTALDGAIGDLEAACAKARVALT